MALAVSEFSFTRVFVTDSWAQNIGNVNILNYLTCNFSCNVFVATRIAREIPRKSVNYEEIYMSLNIFICSKCCRTYNESK